MVDKDIISVINRDGVFTLFKSAFKWVMGVNVKGYKLLFTNHIQQSLFELLIRDAVKVLVFFSVHISVQFICSHPSCCCCFHFFHSQVSHYLTVVSNQIVLHIPKQRCLSYAGGCLDYSDTTFDPPTHDLVKSLYRCLCVLVRGLLPNSLQPVLRAAHKACWGILLSCPPSTHISLSVTIHKEVISILVLAVVHQVDLARKQIKSYFSNLTARLVVINTQDDLVKRV